MSKINKEIAFWALSDDMKIEESENIVNNFIEENKNQINRLIEIDEKIKILEKEKSEISYGLFTCYLNLIEDLKEKYKVFNELVFWKILNKINFEIYNWLEPKWDTIKKLSFVYQKSQKKYINAIKMVKSLKEEEKASKKKKE